MTDPRRTLICFAHAGGVSSDVYSSWHAALPDVTVIPVDLPGRGRHSGRTPVSTWTDLLAHVREQVAPSITGRWAAFGHSLGAAVALDLARAATADPAGTAPEAIFLAGRRPPGDPPAREFDPAMADDQLLDLVSPWGGIPAPFLDRPALRAFALNRLRSDLTLGADPDAPHVAPGALHCPLHILYGSHDPLTPRKRLAEWTTQTTGTTSIHEYPGGHFFLGPTAQAPIALLGTVLASAAHPVPAP